MTREIDVETIPNELKERDQWLLWGSADPDAPKQPHWREDYHISWSDPADWHSFEEAYSAAQENEHWGIGYVFAYDNDDLEDGRYVCLDLDGCLEEPGRRKQWLPEMASLLEENLYMEYSPSGQGIHIPLRDFEPPAWFSDVHFTDDEHEGVDLLANKFCTFTGHAIDVAGSSLEADQETVEAFLADVYEVVSGEDPRGTQSTGSPTTRSSTTHSDGDRLDEEAVEDALRYIDADVGYPTWRNIGFALQDHFGDRTALRLFQDWSRGGRKWDDKAERQSERIIRDASSGGGCTIGTVVHLAKQGGWEPPSSSTWRDRDFTEAVEEETDDVDGLSDADVWEIWADERANGRLDEGSIVPEAALRHLAKEHSLYDFEALDDVDELPPKAHNLALDHVNKVWADDHLDLDSDEMATRRRPKKLDAAVHTWEDVRYIYDEWSTERGRYAAVQLLRDEHEFLTPEDTEELHIYREDLGIFEEGARYDVGRTLDRELETHYSQHEKNEILGRLKEESARREDLEAATFEAPLVCVENGVLDLEERELLEHDPKYKFTTHLPVEYDETAEATRIHEFLEDITKREEDAKVLLELLGNCLLPNYKHEFILFLFGEGANGKSTWLNVVREFLGADNTSSLQLQKLSENRFATARLVGKWANIAEDLPAKKLDDTGTLKDLSGGGEVSAEKKGKDGFDFHNRAKLMFAANRPPVLGERTYAIKRRLAPVYLPYKFTNNLEDGHKDRQNDILEELTTDAELSGLLNAALEGLERLEENGDISLPETPDERLELYEKHSDHVKAFRVDCLQNEAGSRVTKDEIYNAYTTFCEERDREPLGARTFWRNLRKTTLDVTERRLPENENGARPRALDNVAFTDRAEQFVARLGEESECATESDDDDETETTPLSELEPGYRTFEAQVTSNLEPRPWLEAEASLSDGETTVDLVGRGADPGLEAGATYRFEDAKVTTDGDGVLIVEYRDGTTTIKETSSSERQVGLDDATDTTATTDGGKAAESSVPDDAEGPRADINRLVEILESEGALERGSLIAKAADRYDLEPERTEVVIEEAKKRGDIMDSPEGGLKSGR